MSKGILTISRKRFLTDVKKYIRMANKNLSIQVMGGERPAYYFFFVGDVTYTWQNENETAVWNPS